MDLLNFLLLLAALVCFSIAAFVPTLPRVNLVALGLGCWVLTLVIDAVPN